MAEYLRARTVDEALEALARKPFRILAGGTDVYPAAVGGPIRDPILDISGLSALRGITREADGYWRIGALTTWTDVLRADLPPWFDGLKLAAREVGGVQIQTAGTVAGNVCNASPAADGVVPLMAMDAAVEVSGADGTRVEPLDAFITGPRRTTRQPGELVTALLIPDAGAPGVSDFLKLGARHYLVISIAMVAVVLHRAPESRRIVRAGVAVGSCSPVARRLRGLEAVLCEADAGAPLEDLAQENHFAPLSPIDDVRATAGYRREAARTLVRRALSTCREALA
ncbi:Xanthine dehydrogenase [Caenispirillum salinarum AK4]|uniref:Xanthine dehydrogenase n=1 Tax=Caenispirillum salinarum AK4 TaxID=1238182 RepID=K9GWU5_9PROT|nr:FAD binding domain-containing protein [Caenispirillum salinarum]EKV29219.1 Xanthine dehydrogenase [Caenispirillum salinarum AK4]